MTYITGDTIKRLREKKKLTQKQLAEKLMVTDKAVSKWETGRGYPDISILSELAGALSVTVPELMTGDIAANRNVSANMKRSQFYVCPICGNVVHAMGEGVFSCCGIRLSPLEEEAPEANHRIMVENMEDELYVSLNHPMEKGNFISTYDTIQKTCKVFKTLAMIAMIASFIWAGTNLAGLLCGIVWRTGGRVVGISLENVLELTRAAGPDHMIGVLLSDFVFALTDGLLFFFAHRYLKQELADGTPFTMVGAEQVKSLGIKIIVMPLVAIIIFAVIYQCFGLTPDDWDNGTEVVLGIVLILLSLVLRHGAELREIN